MKIQTMHVQLLTEFSSNLLHWRKVLENTSPANYGIADDNWDVSVRTYDFYVHVQERFVEFKNATFTGKVKLFESGKDSVDYPFKGKFTGKAFFEFDSSKQNVFITDISFDDESLNLF